MGRMTKTRKAYKLAQRVKYEDTKPERVVNDILCEIGLPFRRHEIVSVIPLGQWGWVFDVDFIVSRYRQADFPGDYNSWKFMEVDGVYHDTPIQRRKTAWRDELLTTKHGIIHVDAELTKNQKLRDYLKEKLLEAINGSEKVVRIDA